MAEQEPQTPSTAETQTQSEPQTEVRPARTGPDPIALIAGLITLFIAAYVLTDGALWLPRIDVRWVVAGAALVIGLAMLASSFRSGRRH